MTSRSKRRAFEPYDDSAYTPPEQADITAQAEEGVVLAEFVARMALKNHIIVSGLTGPDPYEPEAFAAVACAEINVLIDEAEQSAERTGDELTAASRRHGRAKHQHDYQAEDMDNLRRRRKVQLTIAEILRDRCQDDTYVADLVTRARDDAWAEISSVIEGTLDDTAAGFAVVEADVDDRGHDKRVRQLRREIAKLARGYKA